MIDSTVRHKEPAILAPESSAGQICDAYVTLRIDDGNVAVMMNGVAVVALGREGNPLNELGRRAIAAALRERPT